MAPRPSEHSYAAAVINRRVLFCYFAPLNASSLICRYSTVVCLAFFFPPPPFSQIISPPLSVSRSLSDILSSAAS